MPLLLPLEERLRRLASERPNDFPNRSGSYFEKYQTIKSALDQRYFSLTGAGLALKGERFTRHDRGHVEDVISTAGRLLGEGSDLPEPAVGKLGPYELYVFLLSVLLHDAGNASGREGHELRSASILRDLGPAADLEAVETKLIGSIARAHGGTNAAGERDTIGDLDQRVSIFHQHVHPQRLAAVLRLADEFSENPRRADDGALREDGGARPESVIHNLFCKVVNIEVEPEQRTLRTTFQIETTMLSKRYLLRTGQPDETTFVIDYIRTRLEKSERERRYCNRFLAGWASYDRIRVTINIYDQDDIIDQIVFDLTERGYPTIEPNWSVLAPNFDGAVLMAKHNVLVNADGAL